MDLGKDNKEVKDTDKSIGEILFLPGDLFFCKQVLLPENLKQSEIFKFAHMSVEGLSPLSPEQLFWGTVYNKNTNRMWIYAAPREKILSAYNNIDSYSYVLPTFAPALFTNEHYSNLFKNEDCVSRLPKVDAQDLLKTLHIDESLDFDKAKVSLIGENKKASWVELNDVKVYDNSINLNYLFHGSDLESKKIEVKLPVLSDVFWHADIRDKDFLNKEKKQRSNGRKVFKALKLASYLILSLLCAEIFIGIGKVVIWSKNKQNSKLSVLANELEGKDMLANKIKAAIDQEIRPFELLEILNKGRPDNLYFTSAIIDNLHNVSIEGMSESAKAVDDYKNMLYDTGKFESITISNIHPTHKGARFLIVFDFKEKKV